MTADVPNVFIQAQMPEVKPDEDRVMMKITGVLVDMLVQWSPEVYGPCVVFENGQRVLCVLGAEGNLWNVTSNTYYGTRSSEKI